MNTLVRMRLAVSVALGRQDVEGTYLIRPDDTFLISYPKSGNTWLRFIVAKMLHGDGVDFSNIEQIIPDVYANSSRQLRRARGPRFLKTHDAYRSGIRRGIVIVRDPRSVCISYWNHLRNAGILPVDISFDRYIDMFLDGLLDDFGSWQSNVSSWIGETHDSSERFLLLKYEDLKNSSLVEYQKIATFIGADLGRDELTTIIDQTSISAMRDLERESGGRWVVSKKLKEPFVGTGQTDGWRTALSDQQVARIQKRFGRMMAQLGYY